MRNTSSCSVICCEHRWTSHVRCGVGLGGLTMLIWESASFPLLLHKTVLLRNKSARIPSHGAFVFSMPSIVATTMLVSCTVESHSHSYPPQPAASPMHHDTSNMLQHEEGTEETTHTQTMSAHKRRHQLSLHPTTCTHLALDIGHTSVHDAEGHAPPISTNFQLSQLQNPPHITHSYNS